LIGWHEGKLRAGDRAPDAICQNPSGRIRLFDVFRGSHFTLLAFAAQSAAAMRDLEDNVFFWFVRTAMLVS
jgi:hypothetical protein